MTLLTEKMLDLSKYKKVIYFTGTSQHLEEYIGNYYLAHYNFGDFLTDSNTELK